MENYILSRSLELALKNANSFSKAMGSPYIGTEHILYGILEAEEGIAYNILTDFGISKYKILRFMDQSASKKTKNIQYSTKASECLAIAEETRKAVGVEAIGTELVLFAMLKQIDSNAIEIIKKQASNFEELFVKVNSMINDMLIKNSESSFFENSMLQTYGRNLNELVKEHKIDNVYGREKEINRVFQILSRRTKNNPCLVGEAGVGKTAIVEGLAYKIVNEDVPQKFKDTIIYNLDVAALVAGTKYRGEFEDRIKKVLDEVSANPNIVLFIDEIHTIIGTGSAEGSLDAANILKPFLARGEVRLIGATTNDEYRKHIEKDSALERRFQRIIIEEPSKEEVLDILNKVKPIYEKFHNVEIPDEVLENIVELTDRYIHDRFFPDKAIDVLDEVCSLSGSLATTKAQEDFKAEIQNAMSQDDILKALELITQEEKETKKTTKKVKRIKVTNENVRKVVSEWSKIPLESISSNEYENLINLEKNLKKQIIGQDKAIELVSKAIKRGKSGIKDPKKPIGSFLFLGPTGCGKTETCKALARELFNSEDAIIRFDMSEYMEKHTASKLIGAPPGYVGFDEGGQLTEKVRKKPYSILLFDEIEKAHGDVLNILLQVLDDGKLTDSEGRVVDFKNTIIIMTSNIGAKEFSNSKVVGFKSSDKDVEFKAVEKNVLSELKKELNPEFINRIDEIVVFNRLSEENIKEIANNLIKELCDRVPQFSIKVEKTLINQIVKEGYSTEYGARPIKRSIQKLIENPISDFIIQNKGKVKDIVLDFNDGATVVKKQK